MHQLLNKTPFEAVSTIELDESGREVWVVVVKGCFTVRGRECVLADVQVPVQLAPEYHGEPGYSSLKAESDLAFEKPYTDVILNARAYAEAGRPCSSLDIQVQVGKERKAIRVWGDREWKEGVLGPRSSLPAPFVTMPLVYERAFGGIDLTDPERPQVEFRNPCGVGIASSARSIIGKPLPNLEDPSQPISSWTDRPHPVGLGAIDRTWEPRRSFAGTYDEKWQKERMPLLPLDFDPRFFQFAAPDLIFKRPLRGNEPIRLVNLTRSGLLEFNLPGISLSFMTRLGDQRLAHRAKLDTVLIEPDGPRVILTWRTSLRIDGQRFKLRWTRVFEKEVLS